MPAGRGDAGPGEKAPEPEVHTQAQPFQGCRKQGTPVPSQPRECRTLARRTVQTTSPCPSGKKRCRAQERRCSTQQYPPHAQPSAEDAEQGAPFPSCPRECRARRQGTQAPRQSRGCSTGTRGARPQAVQGHRIWKGLVKSGHPYTRPAREMQNLSCIPSPADRGCRIRGIPLMPSPWRGAGSGVPPVPMQPVHAGSREAEKPGCSLSPGCSGDAGLGKQQ